MNSNNKCGSSNSNDAAEAALIAALNGASAERAAPAERSAVRAQCVVLAECPCTGTRFTLTVPAQYTHGTHNVRAVALRALNPLVTAQMVRGSALVLTPYWHAVRALYALTECTANGQPALVWADALPESAGNAHAWSVLAEWAVRAHTALRNADNRTKHGALRAFAIRGAEANGTVQSLTQWCCDVCSVADHGVPGLYAPNAAAERQAAIAAQLCAEREARDAEMERRMQDAADALARKRATLRSLRDAMDTVCSVLEDLPCAEWTVRHSEVLHATRNSKALHSATTLQRLHARIAEHFPDAHFVGERAAAAEQIVLQHLCTVMLNAAARLRAIALDAEEVAEADALERTALAEQMQSPTGKFHTVAVQHKGAAPAVAAKLGAALKSVNAREAAASDTLDGATGADAATKARAALAALAKQVAAARNDSDAE